MANVPDDAIKATIVRSLHRDGLYCPARVPVEAAASTGIATENRGRAKALIDTMAADDGCPLMYWEPNQTVCLEDDTGKVAAYVRRMGGDEALTWDLKQVL